MNEDIMSGAQCAASTTTLGSLQTPLPFNSPLDRNHCDFD